MRAPTTILLLLLTLRQDVFSFPFAALSKKSGAQKLPFQRKGVHRGLSSSGDDATGGRFTKFIDALSKRVANSPLNEGKKAIARMIAGE